MAAAAKATKQTAKKVAEPTEETPDKAAARLELGKQVNELRSEGKKWPEVAEEMGAPAGALMFAEMCYKVAPRDRVKWSTPEELQEAVVDLRDEQKLSWGNIAARCATGEARCRSAYEAATGNSSRGNRIGKGGRYPSDFEGERPEAKPRKASANGATAPSKPNPLAVMTLVQLKERLNGAKVTLKSDPDSKISVKSVQKKTATSFSLTTAEGKKMEIEFSDVKGATKPKA